MQNINLADGIVFQLAPENLVLHECLICLAL